MPKSKYSCPQCDRVISVIHRLDKHDSPLSCNHCRGNVILVRVPEVKRNTPTNSRHAQVIKEVDSLTNAIDHIVFIKNIVGNHINSADRKKEFGSRLKAIESRLDDATLHLAVVGEFSCGKSSFINAMLRQRLLKTACMATTASATQIKVGKRFALAVTFVDDKRINVSERGFTQLKKRLRKTKPNIPNDATLQDLLDLLTSEKTVADTVKDIQISLPCDNLMDDVTIIDTPGIGAGADYTVNHTKVTQRVLEDIADSAIILIPSASAMTNTLINFLAGHMKHLLHRCIFVLTAMDRLEAEDRAELNNLVNLKLKEKFHLQHPVVLPSSAISMVPLPEVPQQMRKSRKFWQSQFDDLEKVVKQTMIRQRTLILSERLAKLLHSITEELNKDVNNEEVKLETEEINLEESSVAKIEGVLDALFAQCRKKIEKEKTSLKSHVSLMKKTFSSSAKEEVKGIIKNENGIGIESELALNVQVAVEAKVEKYVENVNEKIEALRIICTKVCEEFAHQFEENYKNISTLPISCTIPSINMLDISVSKLNFYTTKNYLKEQQDTSTKMGVAGLQAGAGIGFMVSGPIGLLVGGLLGAISASSIAGDNADESRNKIRHLVDTDINNYFYKYECALHLSIDERINSIFSVLKQSESAHLSEYGAVVEKMIDKHDQDKHRLSQQIRTVKSDRIELTKRIKGLQQLRAKMLAS